MPSAPNQWPSRKAAAIASTTPFSAATSGVIVSSRAKNAGDSAFTSTCAGSASVSHISARAVAAVSSAVKAPCSNSSRTIGSLSTISPSVAGSASPTASSRPRDSACATAARSAAAHRARQFRDQHRAHGDADDAERQFDQAVGEIEPRHRRRRRRGDDRAGDHQQLRRARRHHAGCGLGEKAADFLVERNPQRRRDALATAQHQHR